MLRQALDFFNPSRKTVHGVTVYFKPDPDGVSWNHWEDILNTWFPQFEDIGWLDDFNAIIIGNNVVENDTNVATYNKGATIDIERDISKEGYQWWCTAGESDEYVLLHEFVHHAHMELNGYEPRVDTDRSEALREAVSTYAGHSVNEAIAEIGAGILLGEEFPEWVHEYYEEHDGPMGVYKL